MCGITGYIGYQQAVPIILDTLKKLEYRGYDSAGIAALHCGKLHVRKMKGRINALETRLASEASPVPGTLGIGHTRWATHGEPSDNNSHPHRAGPILVVHNGIIENHGNLKAWLLEQGAVFQSDTDTEAAAHLINYYYRPAASHDDPLIRAVREAVKRLKGSYALGVIAEDGPERILAVRKDSPLIVGAGAGEHFLASDAPALLSRARNVYFLEEGEIAALYRDRVDFFNDQGAPLSRHTTHIDWDAATMEKSGYPHFMLKEIHEQPQALGHTLAPRLRAGAEIDLGDMTLEEWQNAPRVVITACGTAWHAALVAKHALERLARVSVEVDVASEYRYRDPLLRPRDLFMAISQSGETADTLGAARLAKARGAQTLALTNTRGSTLAREADYTLYTQAGPEIAVASTKAFTTQLMAVYLVALKLGRLRGVLAPEEYCRYLAALAEIPEKARQVLADESRIQKAAANCFNKTKVFFMGRQFDYPVSLESALKLKEISYTHSEAFAAGELKHGPIALVDTETLVVALATQDRLFDKIVSNIREVAARGAAALVITWEGERAFDGIAQEVFAIPRTEDCFSPLLSVIPAQLFAYYCAAARGNDPDKPRNLAKSVTVE